MSELVKNYKIKIKDPENFHDGKFSKALNDANNELDLKIYEKHSEFYIGEIPFLEIKDKKNGFLSNSNNNVDVSFGVLDNLKFSKTKGFYTFFDNINDITDLEALTKFVTSYELSKKINNVDQSDEMVSFNDTYKEYLKLKNQTENNLEIFEVKDDKMNIVNENNLNEKKNKYFTMDDIVDKNLKPEDLNPENYNNLIFYNKKHILAEIFTIILGVFSSSYFLNYNLFLSYFVIFLTVVTTYLITYSYYKKTDKELLSNFKENLFNWENLNDLVLDPDTNLVFRKYSYLSLDDNGFFFDIPENFEIIFKDDKTYEVRNSFCVHDSIQNKEKAMNYLKNIKDPYDIKKDLEKELRMQKVGKETVEANKKLTPETLDNLPYLKKINKINNDLKNICSDIDKIYKHNVSENEKIISLMKNDFQPTDQRNLDINMLPYGRVSAFKTKFEDDFLYYHDEDGNLKIKLHDKPIESNSESENLKENDNHLKPFITEQTINEKSKEDKPVIQNKIKAPDLKKEIIYRR